jgi:hypothetical protein
VAIVFSRNNDSNMKYKPFVLMELMRIILIHNQNGILAQKFYIRLEIMQDKYRKRVSRTHESDVSTREFIPGVHT